MSKIALISDLHGDAVTGGVKRFDDVFGFLYDFDVSPYSDIVFCGDLADPDGVDVHACVERFDWMVKDWGRHGARVHLVPGNHDVVEDGRGTTILDVMDAESEPGHLEIAGLCAYVLPFTARAKAYRPADVVTNLAANGLKIDLFIGHLNVEGHGPGSETTDMARGREVFWPLSEIAGLYPNALCVGGHYHKGEDIPFVQGRSLASHPGLRSQATHWLHIVGAPARFTFGEEKNSPSFSVLDTDTMQLNRIPIPTRQVTTLDRLDATGITNGAIVRLKVNAPSRQELEEFAAEELTKKLGCTVVLGADTVISAPVEAAKRSGIESEDPVEAARRLAAEWPAIDRAAEEFRAELVGLVDTIAEEEA